MDIERILTDLKAQREHLGQAIAALSGTATSGRGRRGRKRRHNISAAGRRRLSLMMKRRWAERRKAKKARTTKKPVSRAVTKNGTRQETA